MGAVEDLLVGAVDLHCHSGPSPMPRRINHVEAAQQASDAGFRAIVVKCHYHDTSTDVLAMESQLEGLSTKVYGGVALNSQVGGLNPHAVDLCLKLGGKVIWFPTISSHSHLCHAAEHEEVQRHFQPRGIMQSEEVSIFDDKGELRDEVHTIIDLAKSSGALISTGHLGPEPAQALLEAAASHGHTQLVLSHPNYVVDVDRSQAQRAIELGAVIEHEIIMYDNDKIFPFQVLVDWINLIGPEHTSLGSDLGQVGNPLPVECFTRTVGKLLDAGFKDTDIQLMIRDNPARMLGLN